MNKLFTKHPVLTAYVIFTIFSFANVGLWGLARDFLWWAFQ